MIVTDFAISDTSEKRGELRDEQSRSHIAILTINREA